MTSERDDMAEFEFSPTKKYALRKILSVIGFGAVVIGGALVLNEIDKFGISRHADEFPGIDQDLIEDCVRGAVPGDTPKVSMDLTTDACYFEVENTNILPSPDVLEALHEYVWNEVSSLAVIQQS